MADKEEAAGGVVGQQLEDYSQENLDEVVLTTVQGPDGSSVRIVYRNGGLVDAVALENLCDKVRQGRAQGKGTEGCLYAGQKAPGRWMEACRHALLVPAAAASARLARCALLSRLSFLHSALRASVLRVVGQVQLAGLAFCTDNVSTAAGTLQRLLRCMATPLLSPFLTVPPETCQRCSTRPAGGLAAAATE